MRLLVVDDDPVISRLLQASLSRAGHTVVPATDGRAAWHLWQQDPISLVVTDWMMPGLDGPELISRIRAASTGDYTYIILLTAKGGKDDVVEGLMTGADDYLTKPFHPGELRARVSIGERILTLEMRLREARDQFMVLATHDPLLTGLFNRRALQEHAEAEWQRSARGQGVLSLALLDIDHFKSVNDRLGHAAGDHALRLIGDLLTASKRAYDWAGRWGGEEFLLVLPGATSEDACGVAERVRAKVEASPLSLTNYGVINLRVSIGVSTMTPGAPMTLDTLLQQADEALYTAKEQGRNRVAVYSPVSSAAQDDAVVG